MPYLKALLSVLAALVLAILGPPFFLSLQGVATGMAVFWAQALSPLCLILAVLFFTLFFAASRLHSKSLRVLLFWTPVMAISVLGLGYLALIVYALEHVPRG